MNIQRVYEKLDATTKTQHIWEELVLSLFADWFAAFARYDCHYSLFSRVVLHSLVLIVACCGGIALLLGRTNWRRSVRIFAIASSVLAGWESFGLPPHVVQHWPSLGGGANTQR